MRRSGLAITSVLLVAVLVGLHGGLSAASAATAGAPVSQTTPTLSGSTAVGSTLTAAPGDWSPAATGFAYTWLRDGGVINTTTDPTRTLTVTDLHHLISVRVVASNDAGASDPAASAQTAPIGAGTFVSTVKPSISGVRRWDHVLTGSAGATTPTATTVSYRWFRDGSPITGATARTYRLAVVDFGHRIDLRVTSRRAGYAAVTRTSGQTGPIGHRVAVRRSFTYSIATRGRITADVATFARLVAQTYADPRAWRAAGFAFHRVARGGDFTVYLAASDTLPGFGSPCDSTWSCRVGNSVIINQARWLGASPAWNAQGLPLRSYRNMVVDHETGHWLGHPHQTCPGPGMLAPVMMQQSKGLHGCRFNPFPLPSERWTSR